MGRGIPKSHLCIIVVIATLSAAVPVGRPAAAQTPSPASSNVQQREGSPQDEIVAERTKYSKTFLNDDGSFTTDISPEQINFEDAGEMKEIDPTLQSCSDSGCAYQNDAGPMVVRFASNGAADPLVWADTNGTQVGFAVKGGNPSSTGKVEANRITYPEILPGVDLAFEVNARHVKTYVILQTRPTQPPVYRFPLYFRNVQPGKTASGNLAFKKPDGTQAFTVPRLFMTDSSRDPQSGEPALSEKVALALEFDGTGRPVAKVTPDAQWLSDPARVYPVQVDPTLVDEPSPDTFVQSNILNTAQNTEVELKSGTYDGGTTKARSLLKFQLGSIPDAAIVESASLRLWNFHSWSCDPGGDRIQVYRVTQDWPATVTWPNRPSFAADPVTSVNQAHGYNSSCGSDWIDFGVKPLIDYWRNNPGTNFGFGIRAENESNSYGWRKFKSQNADCCHPKLEVVYDTPPTKPTDLNPPCPTSATDLTPRFSGVYHDPDTGDGGYLEFQVFTDPDGDGVFDNLVRSGDGDFAEPGQRSGWVPDRPLLEGVAYRWRARGNDHKHVSDWTDDGGANKCPYTAATDPPLAPTISSDTHPNPDKWETNQSPTFNWTQPTDPSGISGYSWTLTQSQSSVPDQVIDPLPNGQRSVTYNNIGSGEWWFHVRAVDGSGAWSATAHRRVRIDITPPKAPVISSTSHSNPARAYESNDLSLDWTEPAALSGVIGYSYVLDNVESTVPDQNAEGTTRHLDFPDLQSPATYFFHVRAVGGTGLWGPTATFQINIHPLADAEPIAPASEGGLPLDLPSVDLTDVGGLVPPPPAGLDDLLPSGGLLGTGPFFDGDFLPIENPAEEVTDTFTVMAPPDPPVPEMGSVVEATGDFFSTFEQLPGPGPLQLAQATTYDVETIAYGADGNEVNRRTDKQLPICVAEKYNSKTDDPPVPADVPESPLASFDLRINFCPDASSLEPGAPAKIQYDLDALQNGVHVEVRVTYNALGKKLHLETRAHDVSHPNDFQVVLSSESLPEADSRNTLDSSSSGRLDELRVRLERETPSGFQREGLVTIHNLPARETADQRHRITLESQTTTTPPRRQSLRMQLASAIPNPNEALVLESYDPDHDGKLTARLELDDIPVHFDQTLATEIPANAPPDRKRPDKVTVSGTQPVTPGETLVAEQWDGDRLLGRGTINSFASAYTYEVSLIRDAADRENGVKFSGDFPNGRPDDGSFRLARFHRNQTNGRDELDGLLQIDHFSRSTMERLDVVRDVEGRAVGAQFEGSFSEDAPPSGEFKLARFRLDDATTEDERRDVFDITHFAPSTKVSTRIDGSPTNPTGLHVNVTNSEIVGQQLVEILRTPASGRRARLILAGANVDESRIAPPVDGSNFRWDAIPRTFDLDISVARQANGVPSDLTLKNISSNAPDEGRIKLTQDEGNSTLGMIVKAPTSDQSIRTQFEGSLAKPTMARVSRINHEDQPHAALQFYQQTGGALTSQLRFMGSTASTDGLVSGQPTKIDGVAREVPNHFDYGIELQRNADGFPTDAVISGSNASFASAFTVDLADVQRGFELHQKSFPASYAYGIRARDLDGAGRPRTAVLTGDQSADNGPGRLDLSYRGMRLLMDSLSQTFSFEVGVEGPLDNPTGARLAQSQSSANPNQVIQLIRKGASGPRAALTLRNAAPILPEDASTTDLVWTGVPKDFVLRIGRDTVAEGGERVGLIGDLKGDDRPGSVLRLGQTRGDQRQELRLEGLAPKWATKFRYEGSLPNPRELVVDVASTIRHAGDVITLSNFTGGDLTHRFTMRGNSSATAPGTPTKAEAAMSSITEAFILRYKRVRDSGGDVSQVVDLTNQRVVGDLDQRETRPNADGLLHVELRNNGPSEVVNFEDLPAHFRLAYDRPPVTTDGRPNCLGQLGYNASAPTLDLSIHARINRGCAQGDLTAEVTDMPTQGFSVAKIHPDGDGRIRVAGGEAVTHMKVLMPAPDDLKSFINNVVDVDDQFCKPNLGPDLGCSHIKVHANPRYKSLNFRVAADQLQDVRIATNIAPNGGTDPYPGSSDRQQDRTLWKTVPLIAIRNDGPGNVFAKLTGDDDPDVQSTLHQEVQCCTRPWKTANYSMDYSLDRPLSVRFYTWFVHQGSCAGARGSGGDSRKCNSNGEELKDEFGQNVHCGIPPFDEPIPFPPRFNYFRESNTLAAFPGETMYYVPNPYDIFMSEPNPNGAPYRWAARNLIRTCQTDWFFASLLREFEPDLLAKELASL